MEQKLPAIEAFSEVESTNDIARDRALAGAPHGCAVRADVQTAGRGQRGHSWTSPTGGLYLSVVLRPRVEQATLQAAPLVAGVGATRALAKLGAANIALKWPNDLVVTDGATARKLGGILAEAGKSEEGLFAVVGIGINRFTPEVVGPMPNALPPVGLDACMHDVPELGELAEAVRTGIVTACDEWVAGGNWQASYLDLLAFRGNKVALFAHGGPADGKALGTGTLEGIDPWGRAVVDGRAWDPSEASLRPLA